MADNTVIVKSVESRILCAVLHRIIPKKIIEHFEMNVSSFIFVLFLKGGDPMQKNTDFIFLRIVTHFFAEINELLTPSFILKK